MTRETPDKPLSIGKLSRATGVKIETIRYYERIGLLPAPPRSANGYRQYGQQHLAELGFIRRGRELGFSLDDIRALLALANDGIHCNKARDIARQQIDQLQSRIDDLTRLRDSLIATEQRCLGTDADACPVIDTLREQATQPATARPRADAIRD